MSAPREPALAVLRNRDVRLYLASRFASAVGHKLLAATLAWHVHDLTHSAAWLGAVGLVQFVPVVPLYLLGGAVADATDRRRIVLIAGAVNLALVSVLFLLTRDSAELWPLFAILAGFAVVGSFENPARSAFLPQLVSAEQLGGAITLNSAIQNAAWVLGPMVSGFAIHAIGAPHTYLIGAGLFAVSTSGLLAVRARGKAASARAVSADAVREGVRFVRGRPEILSGMVLDMFAVVFASVTALLPLYQDILGIGPQGYGLLLAAIEIGTVAMGVTLVIAPPLERPGRALVFAVLGFGFATILFGFSESFWFSFAALMLAGASDEVSMVARSTILQLQTPDVLRGRVNSVNMIFVNASNQLGMAESGFLAALTSVKFSVVFGGAASLVALGAIAWYVPELWRFSVSEALEE